MAARARYRTARVGATLGPRFEPLRRTTGIAIASLLRQRRARAPRRRRSLPQSITRWTTPWSGPHLPRARRKGDHLDRLRLW